jgi:putative DNA primase/helicase
MELTYREYWETAQDLGIPLDTAAKAIDLPADFLREQANAAKGKKKPMTAQQDRQARAFFADRRRAAELGTLTPTCPAALPAVRVSEGGAATRPSLTLATQPDDGTGAKSIVGSCAAYSGDIAVLASSPSSPAEVENRGGPTEIFDGTSASYASVSVVDQDDEDVSVFKPRSSQPTRSGTKSRPTQIARLAMETPAADARVRLEHGVGAQGTKSVEVENTGADCGRAGLHDEIPVGPEKPTKKAGSVTTKELADQRHSAGEDEAAWDIEKASLIVPVTQEWLWCRRIPLGEVTVVAGQPGVGKSQFAAFLAAHISTGREWPDGAGIPPHGSALINAVEDNLHATVTPRLMAAGADLERVEVVRGGPVVHRGSPTSFATQLRRELVRRPNVRLVVLDPYDAALQETNVNDQRQMRAAMSSLQQVAVETRTALVLIAHLNKRSTGPATSRIMGSLALVAAARSCILIAKVEGSYVMVPQKQNLAASKGLSFRIIDWAQDRLEASYIEFNPEPVDVTAEELLGRTPKDETSAVAEALQFLLEILAAGPLPAKVLNERALDRGISLRTLERARKLAGVQASRGREAICSLPIPGSNTAKSASQPHGGGLGGIGGFSRAAEIGEEKDCA